MSDTNERVVDGPLGSPETAQKRKRIYEQFPFEYGMGARQGLEHKPDYPPFFHSRWTKDQRNAWFAGYNAGRERRLGRKNGA